jgi:hypothetical protein
MDLYAIVFILGGIFGFPAGAAAGWYMKRLGFRVTFC